MTTETKPEYVTDDLLEYLNELRSSGAINMLQSPKYLILAFGLNKQEAFEAYKYWLNDFLKKEGLS